MIFSVIGKGKVMIMCKLPVFIQCISRIGEKRKNISHQWNFLHKLLHFDTVIWFGFTTQLYNYFCDCCLEILTETYLSLNLVPLCNFSNSLTFRHFNKLVFFIILWLLGTWSNSISPDEMYVSLDKVKSRNHTLEATCLNRLWIPDGKHILQETKKKT